MGYGEIIRAWRTAHGWTQKQLAEQLGCTDSFITQIEHEVRPPSLDICTALANVFQLPPQEQQEFLEEVEVKRRQDAEARIRTRGVAVRGAMRTRGLLTSPPRPAEPTTAEPINETVDAVAIAQDLADNPELVAAYRDLITALSVSQLRQPVLDALRAFAQLARSSS